MEEVIKILNSYEQNEYLDEFPCEDAMEELSEFGYELKFTKTQGEIDEHRWYGLQDCVFEVLKNEISIGTIISPLVVQLYSENMCISDVMWQPHFVECKQKVIETIIYERIV